MCTPILRTFNISCTERRVRARIFCWVWCCMRTQMLSVVLADLNMSLSYTDSCLQALKHWHHAASKRSCQHRVTNTSWFSSPTTYSVYGPQCWIALTPPKMYCIHVLVLQSILCIHYWQRRMYVVNTKFNTLKSFCVARCQASLCVWCQASMWSSKWTSGSYH